MATKILYLCVFFSAALLSQVAAQVGPPAFSVSSPYGGPSSSGPSSSVAGGSEADDYTQSASFKKSSRVLIAHAVLGTISWAFFAPVGAIVLRLNIPGVSLLKLHVICQVSVYVMTIVTTGLGIWLSLGASKYISVWTDSHVIIGLVVLSAASIQPWFGWIHHVVFKRQLIRFRKGSDTKRPGRTVIAVAHIWIGRILILLGIVNGGLGLRLTATTPFQTVLTTRKAEIAYGILAGLVFLLFAGVSVVFEHRRAARIRAGRSIQRGTGTYLSHGQVRSANQRFMPFSPILSEDSLDVDEKRSEIGR